MFIRLATILMTAALLGACMSTGTADAPAPTTRSVAATYETPTVRPTAPQPEPVEQPWTPVSASSSDRSLSHLAGFYENWSAVVISADYRATTGGMTMAFDNARRDFSALLTTVGFDRSNIAQLTMRPGVDNSGAAPATMDNIRSEFRRVSERASDGCLVYLTSHGTQEGLSLGSTGLITPADVDGMLRSYCQDDPTILIVSACYSGVFALSDLARDNVFIMTAARSDRTSFGCGEDNVYPFFDACIIENFSQSGDWLDLARTTRTCVSAREADMRLSPPSSPQIIVGEDMREVVLTPFIAISEEQGPGT